MRGLSVFATALLLVIPVPLLGQACEGSLAAPGSAIASGQVAFTENVTTFGPEIGGNFQGPIFASAAYGYSDIDGTSSAGHQIRGRIGAELLTETQVSVCFTGSAGHVWIDDVDADGQAYEGNLSVGYPIGSESSEVFFAPNASVGVTHATANVAGLEGSDTAAEFEGGVTVGSRNVFVGGSVSYATFDDADPVFGIGVGVAF